MGVALTAAANGLGGSARSRTERHATSIAFAVAVGSYLNALPNQFCFDDKFIVASNPVVIQPGRWQGAWTTDYWAQAQAQWPNRDLLYRPVAVTSFGLVRTLLGPSPLGQHVINIVLHGLAAALVVGLARRFMPGDALYAGLLFAALPVHSEAVVAVVGRCDLLVAVSMLAAILCHDRSRICESSGGVLGYRTIAATAVFVAVGSKENGLAAVPVVMLFDLASTLAHRPAAGLRRALPGLAYLLVPLGAYLALRYLALGGQWHQHPAATKTVNVLVDAPGWQRALGVLQLWGLYWFKTVWPKVLCINYSINQIRLATTPWDPHVLGGLLAALALLAALIMAWRQRAWMLLAILLALVLTYLPASNSWVLIQVFFAERIWYVPSVFACLLLGAAVAPLACHRVARGFLLFLLLAMIGRCWVRCGEWRNDGVLFAAAYRDHPDAVGCLELYGQWLTANGSYPQGVSLLGRAVEIDPGFTDAHRALGQAHLKHGDIPAAVHHLQIAAMQVRGHQPTDEALRRAAGLLAAGQAERLERLRARAEQRPDDPGAQLEYLRALRDSGRADAAIAQFAAMDSRFAEDIDWHYEYAVTLVMLDRRDEAIARYERAVRLDPARTQAAVELAMLLLERRAERDLDRAWDLCESAAARQPGSVPAAICRAELLALRGDIRSAVRLYQQTIEALPADHPQRGILEQRARALGR